MSDSVIYHASMTRIQNVIWKGIKAWVHVCLILPNLRLNEGSKKFSLQSLAGHGSTHMISTQVLTTIPTNIRDILKGEKLLTSYNSRMLLVTFVDVPISYVAYSLQLSLCFRLRSTSHTLIMV